jgi:hypothetical protein
MDMSKTNPTKEQTMSTVTWHGTGEPGTFAFLEHDGENYTLRIVAAGIDIFRDIEGDDCFIGQTDTEAEAVAFINLYATQLIDC